MNTLPTGHHRLGNKSPNLNSHKIGERANLLMLPPRVIFGVRSPTLRGYVSGFVKRRRLMVHSASVIRCLGGSAICTFF